MSGQVVRVAKVFMMARVVQVVPIVKVIRLFRVVQLVPIVKVIRLFRVVQVVPGVQGVRHSEGASLRLGTAGLSPQARAQGGVAPLLMNGFSRGASFPCIL